MATSPDFYLRQNKELNPNPQRTKVKGKKKKKRLIKIFSLEFV